MRGKNMMLSSKLRDLRKKHGLSQKELAEKLNDHTSQGGQLGKRRQRARHIIHRQTDGFIRRVS
ncbi:helix-turn-helix domain-containing protein [Lactobacillus delbrueckii]|uniref:helix-turn-helix domain-containing protein n=1 Tax=Lactobacillus delbrueckii TaxID=1584 RepID=UPI003A862059